MIQVYIIVFATGMRPSTNFHKPVNDDNLRKQETEIWTTCLMELTLENVHLVTDTVILLVTEHHELQVQGQALNDTLCKQKSLARKFDQFIYSICQCLKRKGKKCLIKILDSEGFLWATKNDMHIFLETFHSFIHLFIQLTHCYCYYCYLFAIQ